ncbi:hypothetical protein D9615_007079 [Tricholomella constricta]|uniref:NADH:flavin oxidoreductase/NADH oxidase N-terminal domain-containing protein n=1 Tax=Tricholomella constricta TaxID=117010 RepID=A0A8H5H8C6_9AGAR|nr:hypothetical protein D9615_007079 [Tricholomella constricta]
MATPSIPQLFQPMKVGNLTLSHRVVLAPLTRLRATKTTHVPYTAMVKEYYTQRARTPGTLLITEATFIASKAGGYDNVPGIWSDEQIAAWKEVQYAFPPAQNQPNPCKFQITDAVHSQGSHIFMQLWALGRAARPAVLDAHDPPLELVGPSPLPMSFQPEATPHALTTTEIAEYITLFAQAARNAVFCAGFDGVEVHAANGYLLDQFLQDVSNLRTDEYGGSVVARSKFPLEVVDAVVAAIGPERTALRLTPWSRYQDMGMSDPVPQFTHFVTTLRDAHPTLAYLHVVEPRISGSIDRTAGAHESNDFLRDIWGDRVYLSAGGYTRESALVAAAERRSQLVVFGRWFVSNPDLPVRLREDLPLRPYDRKTFYVAGERADAHVGYVDLLPTQEDGGEGQNGVKL